MSILERKKYKKIVNLTKHICKNNMSNDHLERAIRIGKVIEDKERPLLIALKEGSKK